MAALLKPGDVAVVRAGKLSHDFGAVRTPGGLWSVKADEGISVAEFPATAVWRLPGEAPHGKLVTYLISVASEPFQYGEWDCAMSLANWVRDATGVDPAAHLRGTYHTRAGWARIVIAAGGLVKLVDGIATAAGMIRIRV